MPTIIDSLFLELGIDTTKFSADQKRALDKVHNFEVSTKRAAKGASSSVKTVGAAFQDLAKDSRIGASANRLDSLATKFKGLGASMQASGGLGAPFGMMATGLGSLLSPAVLGAAAIGLVGGAVWDLNKKMTAANATTYRNAQLSNMSAKNMWAWGEAAKTVGGSPAEIEAGISGLQTAVAGAMIGVGSASSQLIGLARLSSYGAHWDPSSGVDIQSLFSSVYKMSQQQGWARTKALVSGYGLMNDTEFNLAMKGPAGFAAYQHAKNVAPENLESILKESIKAQAALGERQISADAVAERAYGALQKPMEDIVHWLTRIYDILNSTLGLISRLVDFIVPPVKDAVKTAVNAVSGALGIGPLLSMTAPKKLPSSELGKMAKGMEVLLGLGIPMTQAAALIGSQVQESSMNPLAENKGHIGLMQWDKNRQAAFAKIFGYKMGSKNVSAGQQFVDQEKFAQIELSTTYKGVAAKLSKIPGLIGKTLGIMDLYEVVKDASGPKRIAYAEQAMGAYDQFGALALLNAVASTKSAVQHTVTSQTKIGDIHVHTPSTDPKDHAAAIRKSLNSQPLLDPVAQNTMALATRGMAG